MLPRCRSKKLTGGCACGAGPGGQALEELGERELGMDLLGSLEGMLGGQRIESLGALDSCLAGQRLDSLARGDLANGSLESLSRQLLGSLGSLPEGCPEPGLKDMLPAHSLGAVPSASGPLPSLEPLPPGTGLAPYMQHRCPCLNTPAA
jgi:hypothetical protein